MEAGATVMRRATVLALALGTLGASAAHAQLGTTGDIEATTAELERAATPAEVGAADPWEGFNRAMFVGYRAFDDAILVPVSKAYHTVTPRIARDGLRNFLENGQSLNIFVNDLLQGEIERAGQTLARFLINSTIGLGGLFDQAAVVGIPQHSEDFGQTLAVWGADSGPYLMLPVFGPSTVRDGVGLAVDVAMDPLFWIRTDSASLARFSRFGATAVSRREPLLEPIADLQERSLDYYASLRSFYIQARKREIANGKISYEELPDIGEYEEFEDLE